MKKILSTFVILSALFAGCNSTTLADTNTISDTSSISRTTTTVNEFVVSPPSFEIGKDSSEFEQTVVLKQADGVEIKHCYFIPNGAYRVTNIGESSGTVFYCSDDVQANADGTENFSSQTEFVLEAGQSMDLMIEADHMIVLSENMVLRMEIME